MSLNDTPSGERIHIGFFGRRNAGKSSLVNAVTGQDMAVVSKIEGTTTDPVKKTMELLPLGPVVIIDTPGFDDEGALGELRVKRTRRILEETDLAVLVVDGTRGICDCDRELLGLFTEKQIPCIIAWNKSDLPQAQAPVSGLSLDGNPGRDGSVSRLAVNVLKVSAKTGEGITAVKEKAGDIYRAFKQKQGRDRHLVSDLLQKGDQVILVIPIDKSAPKGRLILPQQQVIRDILDARCSALCTQEDIVADTLKSLKNPPAMVITDSQVFSTVSKAVPPEIPLTSFSILMARYKGFLETAVKGAAQIDRLKDGDRILIAEGCTHHRQCEDIGTVKLPRWLAARTGRELRIETSSGKGFPEDLTPYALVIHCGGCMLGEREVQSRMASASAQNVPVTNYGTAIAHMNGILERSIAPLGIS